MKRLPLASTLLASVFLLAGMTSNADDGELVRKSMSQEGGNPVLDPVPEAEHAFIDMMKFYVPAQASDGNLTIIDYVNADGNVVDSRAYAKPLIGMYIYGPTVGVEGTGLVGHGVRDAFAAVSLDDGVTWKSTNLSDSASESSFEVSIPIPDPGVPAGDGEIEVDTDTPTINTATWKATAADRGKLRVVGAEAPSKATVTIRNAVTQDVLFSKKAKKNGTFKISKVIDAPPPCCVQAGVVGAFGPATETMAEHLVIRRLTKAVLHSMRAKTSATTALACP